ncbi:hypothetical protein, partial [Klebsiella pneumoniae]|uniref:hypothetical protein n=1 Tax=Klebsiella pneumoniae TaxID=573 RepID=UPI001C2F5C13
HLPQPYQKTQLPLQQREEPFSLPFPCQSELSINEQTVNTHKSQKRFAMLTCATVNRNFD